MEISQTKPKNPGGRPPGRLNKKTASGREAIANFVDGNTDRLNALLDRIAEDDPIEAFKAIMSVVEYHIPKLQRTEVTGKDGERLNISVNTGVIVNALPTQSEPQQPIAIEASYTVVDIPEPVIENEPNKI